MTGYEQGIEYSRIRRPPLSARNGGRIVYTKVSATGGLVSSPGSPVILVGLKNLNVKGTRWRCWPNTRCW